MNTNDLKYYKTIGEIQKHVSRSESFEEALQGGLKLILENSMADYAVIWYQTEENTCVPYYWLCPNDMTSLKYELGEGIVGKTLESGARQLVTEFHPQDDEKLSQVFGNTDVSSICSVPFSVGDEFFGCIEYLKANGSFNEDEADICEVLSMLVQISMNEDAPPLKGPADRKILVSVRDVKKTFRSGEIDTQVLKGVNLDIFEGEMLCLLGESGCGKSTILNIIGGLLNADSGSILFDGKEIIDFNEDELTEYRRKNIGYVFQAYNLMPNLNARQNLDLIAELVENAMPTDEALDLVGLRDKSENYPSELSGGQQQRVSIARAIIKYPKLILADEPTAALDYETSIGVLKAFEKLKSTTPVLMVTHNEAITKMADRVIRFRNGRTYEITVNRHPVPAESLEW